MTKIFSHMASPVGELTLVGQHNKLIAILWENDTPNRVPLGVLEPAQSDPMLRTVAQQLDEYFSGKRHAFELDLEFIGTDFQRAVWAALLTIPFGETRTYQQIAEKVGNPQAVRAVGAANGRNPISIIAPCHRVIGRNGKLTGFAGGLSAKEWLLTHEGIQLITNTTAKRMQTTLF